MEKKELTQEQIDAISAGTGAEPGFIVIIYSVLVDMPELMSNDDAFVSKATAAGATLSRDELIRVRGAVAALI